MPNIGDNGSAIIYKQVEEIFLIGSGGGIVIRCHVSVPRAKTKENNKPSTRVEGLIFYLTDLPRVEAS